MEHLDKISAHRVWLGIFSLWMLILSGVLNPWLGSPGILQWRRLQSLLDSKQDKWVQIETRTARLEEERKRLESSPAAQEREIRRVLGYAAPGEVIFDFTVE